MTSVNFYRIRIKDINGDVEHFSAYEKPEVDGDDLVFESDNGTVIFNLTNVIYYRIQEISEPEYFESATEVDYEHDNI